MADDWLSFAKGHLMAVQRAIPNLTEDERLTLTAAIQKLPLDLKLEKDSPEFRVLVSAVDAAIAPTWGHGPTTSHALVPWWIIDELRANLTKAGVDWQQAKRNRDAQLSKTRR